jgi:hypothetical protein
MLRSLGRFLYTASKARRERAARVPAAHAPAATDLQPGPEPHAAAAQNEYPAETTTVMGQNSICEVRRIPAVSAVRWLLTRATEYEA